MEWYLGIGGVVCSVICGDLGPMGRWTASNGLLSGGLGISCILRGWGRGLVGMNILGYKNWVYMAVDPLVSYSTMTVQVLASLT